MDAPVLDSIEAKVADLLATCRNLRRDNATLRSQQAAVLSEYNILKNKHHQAVDRVGDMIDRLKKVEEA